MDLMFQLTPRKLPEDPDGNLIYVADLATHDYVIFKYKDSGEYRSLRMRDIRRKGLHCAWESGLTIDYTNTNSSAAAEGD